MAEDFFDVPVHPAPLRPIPHRVGLGPTVGQLYKSKVPASLEDLSIDTYLKFLEHEVVGYIGLTQTESALLRGVGARMMQDLKRQLNTRMSGIASSAIRQKMLMKILSSGDFPSPRYCNMYTKRSKRTNQVDVQHIAIAAAVAVAGAQPAAIALAPNALNIHPAGHDVNPAVPMIGIMHINAILHGYLVAGLYLYTKIGKSPHENFHICCSTQF